jgi:hypothetical protein
MPSTNTSNLNLEKPAEGEQSGEWGDTINSNMELIDAAVATKTGTETLTNKTLTSPVLATGVSGTAIKDEDDMASNSASHLATQQSIKAYVDSQTASEEEVEDIVGAMTIGNTETGIAVTYQDADGTIDFVVSDTIVSGDTGSTGITPGDTLTIAGGANITTAMSGDILTITGSFSGAIGDFSVADDQSFTSDAAVVNFGVDSDVTLRHIHDTGLSLSAGANRTQLEVISTDAEAAAGPTLELTRDSASPAASDSLGNIKFIGKNDADENVIYAEISTLLIDPADGAEDGRLDIEVMRAGSLVSAIALKENEIELNAASIDINGTISGAQTFSSRPVLAAGFVVGTDETTISSYYNSGSIYMGRDSDATYYENSGRGIFIYDAVSDSYTGVRMYDTVSTSPVWRHQIAGIIYSEIEATGDFESKDTQYLGISDARLKENIIDSGSQWDDVKAMRFRKYSFISDNLDAPNQLGVIAQELEASGMAGLVKTKPYTNPPKDGEGPDVPVLDADGNPTDYKSVSYSILYMKAAKALQEAMERIETLEAKVTALENA